ncbi:MAG: hypothetical protein AAGU74_06900 [Bacillota bacterium]
MGHLGFSYIGLLFLLMLTVPNLLWIKNRPEGYDFKGESRVLLLFERAGQALVPCTALIFSDFNLKPWSLWTLWLIAACALMILYECWWVRYFRSDRTIKAFYSGFLGIPAAGATLPVAAFLLLGIYGKVIWLVLSVIVLGIGHIGIHLRHQKNARR